MSNAVQMDMKDVKIDGKRMSCPESLVLASKIFLDQELLDARKQLTALKKEFAASLFLDDELQSLFEDFNGYIVKCGCTHCLGNQFYANNYSENYFEDVDGDGDESDINIVFRRRREEKKLNVPLENSGNQCLLYLWFKTQCKKYNCPVPDDLDDQPHSYKGDNKPLLSRVLGNIQCLDDPVKVRSWRKTVDNLPFASQIPVYKMIHSFIREICIPEYGFERDDSPEAFSDWFRSSLDKLSLLP